MSRKRLTTHEMLHTSQEWLNPGSPAHQAILASPDLAPTLPRIHSAHQELASAARPTALNPRLFEIIKEQTDIDDRHDDLIRGIHGLLTSTAALLGPEEGAPMLALRDQLVPDGLSSVQKSYSDEAGQAAQLAARLTTEIRTQIDKIPVGPKGKQRRLGAFIDEWIQLGGKLGELDNEKARLTTSSSDSTTGASIVTARNKWLRTVNLFLAIAEAAELDPQIDNLVFGPLRILESKADRRGRSPLIRSDANNNDADSEASNE